MLYNVYIYTRTTEDCGEKEKRSMMDISSWTDYNETKFDWPYT